MLNNMSNKPKGEAEGLTKKNKEQEPKVSKRERIKKFLNPGNIGAILALGFNVPNAVDLAKHHVQVNDYQNKIEVKSQDMNETSKTIEEIMEKAREEDEGVRYTTSDNEISPTDELEEKITNKKPLTPGEQKTVDNIEGLEVNKDKYEEIKKEYFQLRDEAYQLREGSEKPNLEAYGMMLLLSTSMALFVKSQWMGVEARLDKVDIEKDTQLIDMYCKVERELKLGIEALEQEFADRQITQGEYNRRKSYLEEYIEETLAKMEEILAKYEK